MRRKILITGVNGFVGRHLVSALKTVGDEIVGVDIGHDAAWEMDRYYGCDLAEADAVRKIMSDERPDAVIHLAAVSSVAQSWKAPVESFLNNTSIFLNVVESVRVLGLQTRILSVGSSEEYGNIPGDEVPIGENRPLAPAKPYAVARVSQEQLSRLYAEGFGLDVVMTRSFNQIGPGQRTDFVVPSFLHQLKKGKDAGQEKVTVQVGDLSVVRDFMDVRDTVAAYLLLIERGVAGEVYNVCSGVGRRLSEILEYAARIAGVGVNVEIDPQRMRPVDNKVIVGSNEKMRRLGWQLAYTLEESMRDMFLSLG